MKSNFFRFSTPGQRIFVQITLSIALLIFLVNGISFYLFSKNIRTYFLDKAQEKLSLEIEEGKTLIKELGVKEFCKLAINKKDIRLSLIDNKGVILCDTIKATYDNHLNRPELKEAKINQLSFSTRYSKTTKEKRAYTATKILLDSKSFFLRASITIISIDQTLNTLLKDTLLKIVPTLTLLILSFFYLIYNYSQSLSNIVNKTSKIALKIKPKKSENIDLGSIENLLDEMDSELAKNNENLRFEIEKTSTLLQSISDGILALDLSKRVLFYNVRFTRFFHYHKITNSNVRDILPVEIIKAFEDCLFSGEEQKLFGFKIREKVIDLSIAPIRGQQQKILGAIGIFRNVTQKKQAEQMRVDFVANVSHELKTPLTSIKGFSQLLLQDKLEDKQKKYLDKILYNSEKLIGLFEDLLTLSKIESTNQVDVSLFDIQENIHEIIDYLKNKNQDKEIQLQLDLKAPTIKVNAKLFRQVFYNLLENAVKYSENSVAIKVFSKEEKDRILISIEDNGIGISEEKLSRVFERFYRANESRSNEIKGSGIGLSIVKHIVNKHQGQIEVFSLKQGTEFLISLPLS